MDEMRDEPVHEAGDFKRVSPVQDAQVQRYAQGDAAQFMIARLRASYGARRPSPPVA